MPTRHDSRRQPAPARYWTIKQARSRPFRGRQLPANAHDRSFPRKPPTSSSGVVALDDGANGYTPGMKVAVSIPNDLFDRVEQLRRQERRSRSNLFAVALAEYVARHSSAEVTEAMNRVCAHVNTQPDNFVRIASRRVLERSEW